MAFFPLATYSIKYILLRCIFLLKIQNQLLLVNQKQIVY